VSLPIQSLKGFFFSWSMQKEVFFVVKYSTFLPYPALLIHFWRFSLFFVVKALFYRVALNMA